MFSPKCDVARPCVVIYYKRATRDHISARVRGDKEGQKGCANHAHVRKTKIGPPHLQYDLPALQEARRIRKGTARSGDLPPDKKHPGGLGGLLDFAFSFWSHSFAPKGKGCDGVPFAAMGCALALAFSGDIATQKET